MPCQIETIQCDDLTLQQLFCRLEAAKSLAAIVFGAWQYAQRLAVLITEETLNSRAKHPTEWPRCPKCGSNLQSKGFVNRQITTLLGVVRFKRRVGRCPKRCRIGQIAPLDRELELSAHQHSCVQLKRVACLLAVFVPFETAQVLLEQLISVKVCKDSIWNWVADAGQSAIDKLNAELESLAQTECFAFESIDKSMADLPLLIGADGVMVPFRRETRSPKGATRWREVKVGIVARLGVRRKKGDSAKKQAQTELVQRRLVACLGTVDDLGQRLWLQALRSGITTAEQVVWISDGARGFWRLFQAYFADYAVGILDFYHAAQYLFKAVTIWLDGRTQKARGWFAAARHQLRHGPTMQVRMDIEHALKDPNLCDNSRNVLTNFINYLDTHHKHIQYHQFKAMGLPIGSGMVESACKWLIIQRFKGVGMRWSEDGFNALLQLRLAWVNQRFDELFNNSPN